MMKRLLIATAALAALSAPAFASGLYVKVVSVNSSTVAQVGVANATISAQGVYANVAAPTSAPTVAVSVHQFGSDNHSNNGALGTVPAE
jgi:hypothetical protein